MAPNLHFAQGSTSHSFKHDSQFGRNGCRERLPQDACKPARTGCSGQRARWYYARRLVHTTDFKYALINASPADLEPESMDDAEVPAFITMQEPGEPWKGTAQELKRLSNPEVISWLVVFDTWVGNADRYLERMQHGEPYPHRNDGNVFLSHQTEPNRLKILAYDHTHCHFALISASPQTPIQGKIEDDLLYGNFPEFRKLMNRDLVRKAAAKLLEFTDADCQRIIETIPQAWLTDPATRWQLAEFVKGRALYVADSIERKLFPQGELNL